MDPPLESLVHQALLTTTQSCGASIRGSLSKGGSDPVIQRALVTTSSDCEAQCIALVGAPSTSVNVTVPPPVSNTPAPRGVTASALLTSVLQPMHRIFGTIGGGSTGASSSGTGSRATAAAVGAASGTGANGGGGAGGEDGGGMVSQALLDAVTSAIRAQLEFAFPPRPTVSTAHLTPITDIVVLHENDPPPPGYTRLTHSLTGYYSGDLNAVRFLGRGCVFYSGALFPSALPQHTLTPHLFPAPCTPPFPLLPHPI